MDKREIISILEKIVAPSKIRNVNIFGNEIIIDIITENPSLHAKKKLEKICIISFLFPLTVFQKSESSTWPSYGVRAFTLAGLGCVRGGEGWDFSSTIL